MKTIFKYAYIFLGAALLLLSSCDETLSGDLSQIVFSKEKKTITYNLSVDQTTVNFGSGQSSQRIIVSSNDSWEVTTQDSWIKLSDKNENGFTVSVEANTGSERKGTITVEGTNSGKVTINVTQSGISYDISATPTSVNFGSGQSSQNITVSSNDSWEVTTQDSWIELSDVTKQGFTISVKANNGPERSGTVTIKGTNSGKSVSINVTQTKASDISRDDFSGDNSLDGNGHEYVDLGLSVKWATCNIGASKPEDYGSYFAWGETSPKSYFDWSTYTLCKGSSSTMTKYCNESISGTVDNKTTLEPADDAAYKNWGGSWRMPTKAEQDELRTQCTWTWTSQSGVNGYKVTSKSNGNSIFLPAAGCRYGGDLYDVGSYGSYWSSSLSESYSDSAYYLFFYSGGVDWLSSGRGGGFSVRGVCP
ncbi:MAG: BACON domain-containing protein [Bacteroidaceae bacterium]|nr:BACON domain-containing protein [Bacteroidaceae bacterium]